MPTRTRELALAAGVGWVPQHPPTEPTWEPRRLLLEHGALSRTDIMAMLPEEVAMELDFLQIVHDRQTWQHIEQRNG